MCTLNGKDVLPMIDATWYTRPPNVKDRTSAGGVVVRRDGSRLLVALTREQGISEWVLPKGGVHKNETIEAAAQREIMEEAGLTDLVLLAPLGTCERLSFDRRRWITTHYFLFVSHQLEPKPTDPKHTNAGAWFDWDNLPPLFWPEQRELLESTRAVAHRLLEKVMPEQQPLKREPLEQAPQGPTFLNSYARKYVLDGLSATPAVLSCLIQDIPAGKWDARPDPDRFTLREMVAHIADFEPIFRERMRRVSQENQPILENRDEEQMAINNDYAHADVSTQLARFADERKQTVAFLRELAPALWGRIGIRESYGAMSIEAIATLVLGHDGYHLGQAAAFRNE